jgi:phosphoribosylanthranilate isomerase
VTFIKFCGMAREDDVQIACELGVDAVGFVMWPGSPRHVAINDVASLVQTLPSDVTAVGVFVSPSFDELVAASKAGIRVFQLHGPLSLPALPSFEVWRATTLDSHELTQEDLTLVLDAHDPVRHGGTGRTIDWMRAAKVARRRRVLLAGGLTPGNVAEAIRHVRPFGVDVASGIEDRPGVKNAHAMRSFVAAVREADK